VAKTECAESGIILELLAHKEETYLSIVDNILGLNRRAGSIQRYGNQTVGKGSKIGK